VDVQACCPGWNGTSCSEGTTCLSLPNTLLSKCVFWPWVYVTRQSGCHLVCCSTKEHLVFFVSLILEDCNKLSRQMRIISLIFYYVLLFDIPFSPITALSFNLTSHHKIVCYMAFTHTKIDQKCTVIFLNLLKHVCMYIHAYLLYIHETETPTKYILQRCVTPFACSANVRVRTCASVTRASTDTAATSRK